MLKVKIRYAVTCVSQSHPSKIILLCIATLAFAGCASTPAPREPQSTRGVVSLDTTPTVVPGANVYTRLRRVGSTWVFGRLTRRRKPPTGDSIFVQLNDLHAMIDARAASLQLTCGASAQKCKSAASEEKSLGINYGPFAQLHSSRTDVAATILGNIFDAGGLAGPNGKPLGIRYSKTLDFNAPAYISALNSANTTRAYISNRRNVVEGFNAIRAESTNALASAKFDFVVSHVIDKSGLYTPGSIRGITVGRSLAVSDAAQLESATPISGARIAARYLQDLEQDPSISYPTIVSSMRKAYRTRPVAYQIECAESAQDFAGFLVSVRCPATANARPLDSQKPTVVPVMIVIRSVAFANLFPSFTASNASISVSATKQGLLFENLTDQYESIRNVSIYWGRRILTNHKINITLPPDGKSSYALSSFAFNPIVRAVTRKKLLERHVSTGLAVMYRLGDNVRSLYKRIYVTGATLVKTVESQYRG